MPEEIHKDLQGEVEYLRKTVAELKESEELHRVMLEYSTDPIFCFDRTGKYLFVNKAFYSFFNLQQFDIVGKTLWDIFPKEQADYRFKTVKTAFDTGEIQTIYVKIPKNDSFTHFLTTVKPIKDETGYVKAVISISKDITELKNQEEELKHFAEEMKNLNATKDKFFSIIGHDLKNPFNSILGLSSVLTDEFGDLEDSEKFEIAKNIKISAKSAFALLQDLLDWSNTQTGLMEFTPCPNNLRKIIDNNIKLFLVQALNKNVEIHTDVDPSIIVHADGNMLNTIFRNLISNGIKFSLPNGEILISAEVLPEEISVSVSDRGIGMDQEDLGKLFRIDVKTSEIGTSSKEKGTGLGLILCKEFIEMHKGKISAESAPGKGSAFRFTLPKIK